MSKVVPLHGKPSLDEPVCKEKSDVNHNHDIILIEKILGGQTGAFKLLVHKYQHKIMHILLRYVNEPVDAYDLTQEVFIRAYRSLPNFRQESSFYTWLFRIAVNVAKSHCATEKRRSDFEQAMPEQELLSKGVDHSSPESILNAQQLKQAVFDVIHTLPEELRVAILLREVEGLNYEKIAQILNCPIGTVRSRIHRAREALDKRIKHMF